ncbi:MAG: hypothetical protein KDK71_09670, partial [Chlamydiia bacterium]|nr:hypothetical protein [Chlamydiia bacterium]
SKMQAPTNSFTYRAASDFGIKVESLLLMDMTDHPILNAKFIKQNMIELTNQLGINLIFTSKGRGYFPRDHFIPFPYEDCSFIFPECGIYEGQIPVRTGSVVDNKIQNIDQSQQHIVISKEEINNAIEKAFSYMICDRSLPFCYTKHDFFLGFLGKTLSYADQALKDFRILLKQKKCSPLFLEGGTIYTMTVKEERVTYLSESLFYTNLILHRKSGLKATENRQGIHDQTIKEIYETFIKMFLLGLCKIEGNMGTLTPGQLTTKRYEWQASDSDLNFVEYLKEKKLIAPLPLSCDSFLKQHALLASKFKSCEDWLFASFRVLFKSKVVILPEAGYHFDIFMRPGPRGTMLLQSYKVTTTFLEIIQKSPTVFSLSEKDLKILPRYIATAKKLHDTLEPLLKKISSKLIESGVPVIDVPAVFYDETFGDSNQFKGQETYHVNFINGISGFSSKRNKYYFITLGAQVGDFLGQSLMDIFCWYMQQLEPQLEVYYVGRNPDHPEDYSESMRFLNVPFFNNMASQAGLHCMTVELKYSSHTE